MRNLSLTSKLLLSTLIPILITFFILILSASYNIKSILEPFVMISGLKQIESRAGKISATIAKYQSYLNGMASDSQLVAFDKADEYQNWLTVEFKKFKKI